MKPPLVPRDRPNRWRWFALGLVLIKLWLVASQPITAASRAGHDDRLYLRLAEHILQGEWLGAYSQYTLMKGPMYSLWIAFNFLLGLPLPLGQHLLYLAGCWLVVRALRPYLESPGKAFAVFVVLWWNPMTYELPVLGRILRQNLYTPLTLLFFAALIAVETRRAYPAIIRIAWGALLGASGAALYLTREETIWVVPSMTLLLAAAGWNSWRVGEKLKPLFIPLFTGVACFALSVGTICQLNATHYRWFGTVEFRAPQFLAAYGSLQRVIPQTNIPYVPVTREAREKIYTVSPSFAELRPFLEGAIGFQWADASTSLTGKPGEAHEIAGGWFMWALRDSVIAAGYNKNAEEALAYYQRLAAEVNAACDDGRLKALSRRDSMVPPWRPDYTAQLIERAPAYLRFFLLFRGFSPFPAPSNGDADLLLLFGDLTRWHLSPSPEAPQLDHQEQLHFDEKRMIALKWIGKKSCWAASVLVIVGLIGWAVLLLRALYIRKLTYLLILATAALVGSAAVVAINLLVDVVSFPNLSTGALAQAYPLILLFGTLIVIEIVAVVTESLDRRSQPPLAA